MHRRASDNTTSEDFSYIWRPTIEQDNDRSFGIVNVLVSAVRDAANQICKNEPHKILEVIRILETHQWAVFRRITLHLIRSFPGTGSSEIRQRLTNKELFEENWHEYALLLQAKFSKLSPADQKTILSWIEKGPDLPGLTETASVLAERQPTTEDIQKYTRKWQLQRLVPIREWLVDRWEERYEELATEFGPPKNIHDAPFVITSWVGPTSPLDLNALRSMTIEALVDFLKTWQPSNDHYSPTPEGLGRELAPVVASDPQKFAKHANDFRGLEPTYVRSLLSGFRDAAGQKRTFGWNSVLELCWWVVQQPRDHHVVSTAPLERDTHWGWARKTIAELLEQGFSEGSAEIAFDLRETAWKILKVITEDPEPTPEYEEKYGGSNMDPAHIAINTTRGEAIHAVMYYALWVHRALGRQSKGDEKLASNSFDRMPEVRDVLQRHLTTDPSLGVRSAYGRFFPQLYFLDPDWTTQELYTIFPLDTSLRPFFDAAWTTFILFGTASEKTFDVLQPVYRHAMGFLSDQPNEKADTHNERLVAHLVHYYLWGKLEIDEPHGLLQLFWSKGHAKLRGFIFEYAGRLVADVKREIPETTVQRLKSLWEFRLKVAKTASNPMQYKEELASFGWYFGSGQFDPQWATSQLKEVLRLVSAIDFPKYVVERLAALATTQPQASIECAQLLVESDLQHWEIYGWRNELKTILRIAMQSESARARQGAVDLTHRLGAKGYFEFRELLQH